MSGEICYTVRCRFTKSAADSLAEKWLSWLRDEHIADVLSAGATTAEILQMDDQGTYEIRYRFPDRSAFESYVANHAPRLREEGLRRFPIELGLSYSRAVGEVRSSHQP